MSKRIHAQFVEIAEPISYRLSMAIDSIGPVQLKPRRRRETDLTFTEILCRAVAGQQLSTKAAQTIWGRVVDSAGRKKLTNHIRQAEPELLRECGLSGSKVKAMKSIVTAETDGLLDTDDLGVMSHEDRSATLTSIWGVGQWTADMMGIFYFGDQDVWPSGDVTVLNTLQRLTNRRRNPDRTAQRFSPHRSYLAMYLYRIADAPPT